MAWLVFAFTHCIYASVWYSNFLFVIQSKALQIRLSFHPFVVRSGILWNGDAVFSYQENYEKYRQK